MSAAKSPRTFYSAVLMSLAAALVIAGCGGAGGKVVSGQSPPKNPPSPAVETRSGAGTEAGTAEGGEATSEGEEGMSGAEEGGSESGEGTSEGEAGGAEAESGGAEASGEGESEGTEAAGESAGGAAAEGMTVFTANCGTCHTLRAAGTSGNVGPNLDELMPSESTVETQVINGGGAMPAFGNEGILTSAEVKAVAAYVSSEAGK